MLPTPVSSFTIPSLHDDTPLDCRLYHPLALSSDNLVASSWQKRGAIIAHPYGPLGGCYDDPVVLSVVTELLKHGFILGTFNFRGSGSSKGRTSWNAKPELLDYMSFVGFFVYYIDGLKTSAKSEYSGIPQLECDMHLSPIQSGHPGHINQTAGARDSIVLILGGYSYGSLITTNLPLTETILAPFSTVTKGTAAAEIRLRALHLSSQWNSETQQNMRRGRGLATQSLSPASPHSIVFGGDESEPGTRRASRESRRSIDVVRRSMDRSKARLGLRHFSSEIVTLPQEERLGHFELTLPLTHYLLVSPLLPPVSMFATMFTKSDSKTAEDKLRTHLTLAIYGDKDFFTSHKKLRKWASHLAAEADSRFIYREVNGAGHFWHEQGVDGQMRRHIGEWVKDILGEKSKIELPEAVT